MRGYLKPGGRFILVEYNVDSGNTWVPYPLSYPTWEKLAVEVGFRATRLRTVEGSLLTIPNSTIATASINNLGAKGPPQSRAA